jgi:hypothetical protein
MGVRESGEGDRVPAMGKIEKAGRPHDGNFEKSVA